MFRTKFKQHVNLQAVYTWSHSISDIELDNSSGGGGPSNFSDYTNHRLDKGNSTINRPHIFVLNTIINGPELKGSNLFVRNTLGGWEFTTITTAESGNSMTVFTPGVGSGISSLSGTGFTQNQRPNIVPGIGCNSSVGNGQRDQIFNPAAFTLNGFQIGTIGNEPRGYCHGPSNINSDLAFYKNWKVAEKLGIQFRMEFFNAFNHANFRGDVAASPSQLKNNFDGFDSVTCGGVACTPANNVITDFQGGNPDFGKSIRTRGPREIQYAIKFTF
jgi:hypothetical protein